MKRKIVVAVTGASGAIYAKLLFDHLFHLKDTLDEIAVVFSEKSKEIWEFEKCGDFKPAPPFKVYDPDDFFVPFASGSSSFDTMIICPCSMGTLGRIAGGHSDNLISRAADVMLKERQRLILVTRETPLNLIHIENMRTVTLAGGIICHASPSFYSHPDTIEELLKSVTNRILKLAGFDHQGFRWCEK